MYKKKLHKTLSLKIRCPREIIHKQKYNPKASGAATNRVPRSLSGSWLIPIESPAAMGIKIRKSKQIKVAPAEIDTALLPKCLYKKVPTLRLTQYASHARKTKGRQNSIRSEKLILFRDCSIV